MEVSKSYCAIQNSHEHGEVFFFFEICGQYEHAPSKVSLALDWANGWSPKVQFSVGQQIFLFSKTPGPTPKHTQSPIPSVPEAFVPGLKQAAREADRSAPCSGPLSSI